MTPIPLDLTNESSSASTSSIQHVSAVPLAQLMQEGEASVSAVQPISPAKPATGHHFGRKMSQKEKKRLAEVKKISLHQRLL